MDHHLGGVTKIKGGVEKNYRGNWGEWKSEIGVTENGGEKGGQNPCS